MPYPAIQNRQEIVQDALQRIQSTNDTLKDIAADHGIHYKTLQGWLLGLGDEYANLRQQYIDQQLIEASDGLNDLEEKIRTAAPEDIPRVRAMLEHAKTRWNKATWIAERRDRARYGQQPQIGTGSGNVTVQIVIGSVNQESEAIDGTATPVVASDSE